MFKSFLTKDLGDIPPPPQLPKYDPNEEAPMWNYKRICWNLPVERVGKPWTKVGTQPESPDDPDWRGVIRSNVIEYDVVEPYKHGRRIQAHYFWFDTPDYADPFKKLGYSLKFFTGTGLIAMCIKGFLDSYRFTTANNLILFRKVFLPCMLGGMAASMTVISLANIRNKKDDMYNYLAAGLVFGAILGRKDHRSYFRWTTTMVPLSLFSKYNAETNGQFWPQPEAKRHQSWGFFPVQPDTFLLNDFRFFGLRGMTTVNDEIGRNERKPY